MANISSLVIPWLWRSSLSLSHLKGHQGHHNRMVVGDQNRHLQKACLPVQIWAPRHLTWPSPQYNQVPAHLASWHPLLPPHQPSVLEMTWAVSICSLLMESGVGNRDTFSGPGDCRRLTTLYAPGFCRGPTLCDECLAVLCAKVGVQLTPAPRVPASVSVGIRWPIYKDNCCR